MDIVYSVIGEQIHLPFYVSGVGIADPEYHIFRENGLISHQILFTASGTGCLEIDGKSYEMPEGSLFYVKPGVVHKYYPKEEGKWKTCWVVFRGEMLDALMENMGYGTYYIGTLADLKYTYALFHKILDAAKEPCHGAENSSKVLYEYILHIRRVILGLEEQVSDFLRLE